MCPSTLPLSSAPDDVPPTTVAAPSADPGRARRDQQLATWLQCAAEGDAAAFEQFYDASVSAAQCLAHRLLRGADVDDLLAECYFQAWREAGRFDASRGSAITWLLNRVRSRAIDLLRAQRRAPACGLGSSAGSADDTLDAVALQPASEPGPDELLAQAEAGSQLHAALAQLAPSERWVLGLAYFRDCSHGDIATATGLPLGTVKSLLLRAQAKLRTRLAAGQPAASSAQPGVPASAATPVTPVAASAHSTVTLTTAPPALR